MYLRNRFLDRIKGSPPSYPYLKDCMSIVKHTDPVGILEAETISLAFHGCACGYDEDQEPIYSVIYRPLHSDPATVKNSDLIQIMHTEDELRQLIAASQSALFSLKSKEDGTLN